MMGVRRMLRAHAADEVSDRESKPTLRAIAWAAATRRGSSLVNQDRIGIDGVLFSLADGMGGLTDSERAASVAVAALHAAAPRDAEALSAAVFSANSAVCALATEAHIRTGTTLAALLVADHEVLVVSVGDARVHLGVDGEPMELVTVDDTLAAAQGFAQGTPEYEHASTTLTAFLGDSPVLDRPALRLGAPARRARVVLTSDGVHDVVPPSAVTTLASDGDPCDAAERLVDAATKLGTRDDATALVVDIKPSPRA